MPKPIKPEILKALKEYQQRVADILTKQGVKAHVVGDLKAYKKLAPIAIDFGSVQKGAKEFGVEYGALLRKEGATMIHGKKVAWLAESVKDTRGKVSNIITEGVRTGKGTDAIARELRGTLIRDKNYEYKRIARTETGNIQAHAANKRYKEEGVEEVDWLCGQKPCDICAQYCGKRYKINEAPDILVHPNCTCDKAPVVTRRVREKIDEKAEVTKKPLTKKDKLKQLKKEERSTANELWKKTSKDGKEHQKTITKDGHVTYFDGDSNTVEWTVPRHVEFAGHHTHPGWDSPLSGKDLWNLLSIRDMTQNSAASSKNIYICIKTKKTKAVRVFDKSRFLKEFKKTANAINTDKTDTKMLKTLTSPTKKEAWTIWHDANDEVNKIFAKKYNYEYISFPR